MSDTGGGRAGGRGAPAERLAADVTEVVREEVRAVRAQLADAARPAGVGFLLLAAAGGCVVLGIGAASTTTLRMLEALLPRRLAAAGLTAGYLAAAAFLGSLGLQRLRAAGGSSARLADQVGNAVSSTAGRVMPAGTAAVREGWER
ncbi:phage holin family protein [Micromonospora sp. DR5-3]|uniref:phage holin family protein n=1 Tax=unclassified Micromonospora TaxID=2617518 RepID=UPI0011D96E1D|nr:MULTISPECIES: phage holin family protein [unclassified Micromonospora]MCW3815077.1 phage holin family protein [Micromonospora sp. DR5-3]TYC25388.1 phage holin family protein [Micromonospora sp. MP36]